MRARPPYCVVVDLAADEFLEQFAPQDVRDTVAWLLANGYILTSQRGTSTFGAQFVYTCDAEVVVTVDRSQWVLDVAPTPGAEPWQYDLLVAAHSGRAYGEALAVGPAASLGEARPAQLPQGVSWRESLPRILRWMKDQDVSVGVGRARQERDKLMWPRKPRR
jgi:hypothetical protein